MPTSVDSATETSRGWLWWMSPRRASQARIAAGSSLPSTDSALSSFTPAQRSGAPHSSTSMWAPATQTTASWGRVTASIASTFAAVPLKTGKPSAFGPKCSRITSSKRFVQPSSP